MGTNTSSHLDASITKILWNFKNPTQLFLGNNYVSNAIFKIEIGLWVSVWRSENKHQGLESPNANSKYDCLEKIFEYLGIKVC